MNVNVVAIIGARITRTINSVNLLPVLVLARWSCWKDQLFIDWYQACI